MKKQWWLVGAVAALTLTACSGDDAGSANGNDATPVSSIAGDGAPQAAGSEFCKQAEEVERLSDTFSALFDQPLDRASAEPAVDAVLAAAEKARRNAPEAVADDVAVSIEAMTKFKEFLAKVDYDLAKLEAEPDFQAFSADTKYPEANQRLQQYLSDQCGITPDPETPADQATATTTPVDANISSADVEAQVAAAKQLFPKLSETQVRCLVDKGMKVAAGDLDPTGLVTAITGCGIDPADLVPEG